MPLHDVPALDRLGLRHLDARAVRHAALERHAAPKRYRSSTIAWRGFCGECGSPICFQIIDKPEILRARSGLPRPAQRFEARRSPGRREPHRLDQDRRRSAAERFLWVEAGILSASRGIAANNGDST